MKPFVDRRGVGLSFFNAETYTCIPLTIAPKLRICIGCSKRFQDRQGVSSLEQVRPAYTDSCVSRNRRPKCTTLLPLELHFLPSGRLKLMPCVLRISIFVFVMKLSFLTLTHSAQTLINSHSRTRVRVRVSVCPLLTLTRRPTGRHRGTCQR